MVRYKLVDIILTGGASNQTAIPVNGKAGVFFLTIMSNEQML